MPTSLITIDELKNIINTASEYSIQAQIADDTTYADLVTLINSDKPDKTKILSALPHIDEATRDYLALRDTDNISEAKVKYARKKVSNQNGGLFE
jgi:uncharacterized protein YdaL